MGEGGEGSTYTGAARPVEVKKPRTNVCHFIVTVVLVVESPNRLGGLSGEDDKSRVKDKY